LAWFLCAFMAITLLGIAYLFLRASALDGRQAVLRELTNYRMARLRRITELSPEVLRERLGVMRVWPLRWPQLNQTLLWYAMIFLGLIFYKLGMVLCALAVVFVVYNTIRTATVAEE